MRAADRSLDIITFVSEHFRDIIVRSFEPGRTFMSYLRITRFFEGRTVELKNGTLTWHEGPASRELRLRSLAELERATAEELGLPGCHVGDAVRVLERVTGRALFDSDLRSDGF